MSQDSALLEAMADSFQQKRVIFLVENDDATSSLVRRAQRMAIERVCERTKIPPSKAEQQLFEVTTNEWLLKNKFGGWLFFFPLELFTPAMSMESLGTPDFVYWPDPKGVYDKTSYMGWMTQRETGHVWRPTFPETVAQGSGRRSFWQRLRER